MEHETTEQTKRAYFRHTLATLAYRAEKVLRDAPDDFANLRISPASRTPLEIVSHLGDLMAWATSQTEGESRWQPQPAQSWDEAVDRFFSELAKLDDAVAAGDFARMRPLEVIFQGPVADALTHVGQVGMLRGVAGLPVRAESYARARIQAGRIGREQSDERSEFDGDASWPTPSR